MKKLKIGFVLDDTLDSTDGVQQYVLTLATWLITNGHEVHYLVGNTVRTDLPHVHSLSRNMSVRFNGNRMSTPLPTASKAIRALLAAEQFDVLHVQVPYSPFMASQVILNAPTTTVVFGTFHIAPHSSVVRIISKLGGPLFGRSLRRFNRIVSVSRAAAVFAKQTFGIDSDVLPNVVEVARYQAAEPFAEYETIPTIVFVGRLVQRKGCGILLEAVTELQNNGPINGLKVLVCGRGPLEAELKAYVTQHNLTDTVIFTGYVTESDKARYLKSADVAVFPSTGGESFGIVLIEAMAAHKPVVLGADNPGYATVLEDYPDLLFPVKNASALATKLRSFLQDDIQKQHALTWQAQHVEQFDVGVVGQKLVAMYEAAKVDT